MMPPSPKDSSSIRAPHPLATRLIERHAASGRVRVVDFAAGSGRNTSAFERAGFETIAISDAESASHDALDAIPPGSISAAISTHGLLHGTAQHIAGLVERIAARLEPGGTLYATFGSVNDARFGTGTRIDDATYAPVDGDERGVAHGYFTGDALRTMLEGHFVIESLAEHPVDDVAGAWAHQERPLSRAMHWFAVARRRSERERK